MTSLQVLGFDVFSDLLVEGVMTTPIVPVVLKHEVMPVHTHYHPSSCLGVVSSSLHFSFSVQVMDIKPDVVSVVTRNAMKKNIPRPPCVTEEVFLRCLPGVFFCLFGSVTNFLLQHVSLLRAGDRLYLEVMSALGKEKVTRVYLHEAPEWLF